MIKILHVVGARPNFMKADPVIRAMKKAGGFRQTLVHTGQHYDAAMSEVFFKELGLRRPDVNLDVGSASQTKEKTSNRKVGKDFNPATQQPNNSTTLCSHREQIAEIMKRFRPILISRKPDWVFVYGDVNSTVACARVAAEEGVPVAHVEAGLRSFDMSMPEEINRIETDQLADLLFVTEKSGIENLKRELTAENAPQYQSLIGTVRGRRRAQRGRAKELTTENAENTKKERGGTDSCEPQYSGRVADRGRAVVPPATRHPQVHFVGNTMIDSLVRLLPEAGPERVAKLLGCQVAGCGKGKKLEYSRQKERIGTASVAKAMGAREGHRRAECRHEGNEEESTVSNSTTKQPNNEQLSPPRYVLVTLHRPSNVDDPKTLARIMKQLERVAEQIPVVFPIHPRTQAMLEGLGCLSQRSQGAPRVGDALRHAVSGRVADGEGFELKACTLPSQQSGGLSGSPRSRRSLREVSSIVFLPPAGYLDFLALQANAAVVVTDSGGIQEETSYLGVPCLTVRANTERPVTIEKGTNRLIRIAQIRKAVMDIIEQPPSPRLWGPGKVTGTPSAGTKVTKVGPRIPKWDGHAAERIVAVMKSLDGTAG